MARHDRWRDSRNWDYDREARGMDGRPDHGRTDPTGHGYPYRDWRREAYADERYRRETEAGYADDERAYRPFGSNGPTAYYGERPYGYGGPGGYAPYGMGSQPQPSNGYEEPRQPRWLRQRDFARERHYEGRAGEPRSFMDKAHDEVASWFGDRDAGRRRHADEIRAESHRGRGPKDYRRSDERIREDVNERLTEDPYLDATDILVEVAGGEVTLTGQVACREDKRRAERLAEEVSGVGDVQNSIRVRPDEGRPAGAAAPSAGNF
jgi:hypothetical protein